MTTPSITNADDPRLVEMIRRATARVMYVAPGVSDSVADAIIDAWGRLGPERVQVVLDVDAEICRLGYGTLGALRALRDAANQIGALVCEQPGVRIGLLITDEATLIYSPTPLLIEAGSDRPERPNAILLGDVPGSLERDVGFGEHPDRERVIGLDAVQPDRIAAVEADLQAAPPVRFDLARRVRVFTSRFQFVELEMTGCFVSRKKVRIPSSLVGLARNEEVEQQFHAHFDLVQRGRLEVKTGDSVITERSLLDRRREIEKRFLVSLTGYGTVVLRANKEKFIEAVDTLRHAVEAFSGGVTEQLSDHIERGRKAVAAALLPAVERNPPDEYTKTHGPHPPKKVLSEMLDHDITEAFGTADALVKEMQVKVVFKDVAYESLVDSKFIETARKAMPHVEFLHDEFDAAAGEGDEP